MKRNDVNRDKLSPMMKHYVELKDKYVFLNIVLPSGSTLNINPNLFFDKIKESMRTWRENSMKITAISITKIRI